MELMETLGAIIIIFCVMHDRYNNDKETTYICAFVGDMEITNE